MGKSAGKSTRAFVYSVTPNQGLDAPLRLLPQPGGFEGRLELASTLRRQDRVAAPLPLDQLDPLALGVRGAALGGVGDVGRDLGLARLVQLLLRLALGLDG